LEELGSDEEIDLDEIEWSDEEEEDNNSDNENQGDEDDEEIPKLEPIAKDEVSRSSKTSRTTAKSDVSSRLEAREVCLFAVNSLFDCSCQIFHPRTIQILRSNLAYYQFDMYLLHQAIFQVVSSCKLSHWHVSPL